MSEEKFHQLERKIEILEQELADARAAILMTGRLAIVASTGALAAASGGGFSAPAEMRKIMNEIAETLGITREGREGDE